MPRNALVELRHLHYFLVLSEELNFGRAARRLGIAQPPLSQQIRRLEKALGVELIDRSQRRIRLTAGGRALAGHAPTVLEAAAALREQVQLAARGKSGLLRIGVGASASLGVVPEMIAHFRALHPEIAVQLDDSTSAPHVERLRQRLIDIALLRAPVRVEGLRMTVIRDEPLVAVLPAAHRLANRRTLKLSELADEPFVHFPRESSATDFYDALDAAFAHAGFIPRIVEYATQWATVAGMVAVGTGVAVAPQSAALMPRAGTVYVKLSDANVRVQLVAVSRDEDDPLVRTFIAALQ
jgi:LysR family transcriptional regulator, benzoate and cis,cis-muconate-responsive activator of ben and cat genes